MRMVPILILAILVMSPASDATAQCAAAVARGTAGEEQNRNRERLIQFGYGLGAERDSLLRKFGRPDSVRSQIAADGPSERRDSVTRVVYRSFAVHYAKSIGAANEVAYFAEVFATDPRLRSPLPLGTERRAAASMLGPAIDSTIAGDTTRVCLLVSPRDEAEEFAVLEFVRGVLVRIRWLFYWG